MVSNPEDITYNSTIIVASTGTTNKHSARKLFHHFSGLFDANKKTYVCKLGSAKTKCN